MDAWTMMNARGVHVRIQYPYIRYHIDIQYWILDIRSISVSIEMILSRELESNGKNVVFGKVLFNYSYAC
jgi:hypothetical protein